MLKTTIEWGKRVRYVVEFELVMTNIMLFYVSHNKQNQEKKKS